MNYGGIDLHSNNSVVSVIDEMDRVVDNIDRHVDRSKLAEPGPMSRTRELAGRPSGVGPKPTHYR